MMAVFNKREKKKVPKGRSIVPRHDLGATRGKRTSHREKEPSRGSGAGKKKTGTCLKEKIHPFYREEV